MSLDNPVSKLLLIHVFCNSFCDMQYTQVRRKSWVPVKFSHVLLASYIGQGSVEDFDLGGGGGE